MGKKTAIAAEHESPDAGMLSFPGAAKAAKYLLAAFGVLLSLVGGVVTIAAYASAMSSLNSLEAATDAQLDVAALGLGDVDAAMAPVEDGASRLPPLASNLSASLTALGAATATASTSLETLAAASRAASFLVSADAASGLASSARTLAEASLTLNASANEAAALASDAASLGGKVSAIRARLSQAAASLAHAKDSVGAAFDSARTTAALAALLFFIGFAVLLSSCVACVL